MLQGTKVSALLKEVISDVHHLKHWGGCSVKLSRKNENIRPFEAGGETSLEFLSQKTDCSLFLFASHSKKRPHNLVFGRMFDHHVYDMVEVGVERAKSIKDLKGGGKLAQSPASPSSGMSSSRTPSWRSSKASCSISSEERWWSPSTWQALTECTCA